MSTSVVDVVEPELLFIRGRGMGEQVAGTGIRGIDLANVDGGHQWPLGLNENGLVPMETLIPAV